MDVRTVILNKAMKSQLLTLGNNSALEIVDNRNKQHSHTQNNELKYNIVDCFI